MAAPDRGPAGLDQLGAGRQYADRQAAGHLDPVPAVGGEYGHVLGAEHARRQDDLARAGVLAAAYHVVAALGPREPNAAVRRLLGPLEALDARRSGRERGAGHDAGGLAGAERVVGPLAVDAGGAGGYDASRAERLGGRRLARGGVPGPAVHRRLVEGRLVHPAAYLARDYASERGAEADLLGRRFPPLRSHDGNGLVRMYHSAAPSSSVRAY